VSLRSTLANRKREKKKEKVSGGEKIEPGKIQ
jgi:hypothetical protein